MVNHGLIGIAYIILHWLSLINVEFSQESYANPTLLISFKGVYSIKKKNIYKSDTFTYVFFVRVKLF